MSGIYIKGMEMPTDCSDCFACHVLEDGGLFCEPLNTDLEPCSRGRLANCPLVPVPEHGRLIDVKSLENMHFTECMYDAESKLFVPFIEVASAIFDAPTIIPEDKEGYT